MARVREGVGGGRRKGEDDVPSMPPQSDWFTAPFHGLGEGVIKSTNARTLQARQRRSASKKIRNTGLRTAEFCPKTPANKEQELGRTAAVHSRGISRQIA
jgi:hypothetical protein